ncbi:hypothetical protein ACFWPH_29900 [Nocardia sp. NPDC058499]|uniref:hypothetical protein n=1 Tax=Nocardia sp. NPDC058499 TaxID=3346530 RepID=UPI0036581101
MTAAVTDRLPGMQWVTGLSVLQRVSAGLKVLDSGECRYIDPIRSLSHAHYVMHLHQGHCCARYEMAMRYTLEAGS